MSVLQKYLFELAQISIHKSEEEKKENVDQWNRRNYPLPMG